MQSTGGVVLPRGWQNRLMTYGTPGALRATGPLRPSEMAQAAVMAALCAACAVIAVVVPFGQVFSLLGTVPMGLLAYRYRIRVLIAALVAGGMITFLVAGLGGFMTVVNCAYIGGLTGIILASPPLDFQSRPSDALVTIGEHMASREIWHGELTLRSAGGTWEPFSAMVVPDHHGPMRDRKSVV